MIMGEVENRYRVFVSAAEASGDEHCANLIKALRQRSGSKIEFVGVGGPKMAEAGCELLVTTTDSSLTRPKPVVSVSPNAARSRAVRS